MKEPAKTITNTIIVLSEDDFKKISDLASINADIKAIARFMNISTADFEAEYMNENSQVYRAIEKGLNSAEHAVKFKQLENAKLGDKESAREWKKDASSAKWERYKQKLLFDQGVSKYETLRAAVEHGATNDLPEKLQKYYEVLDFIRTLYNKMNSRTYIINQVRLKWTDISYSVANKLYYEALNFFNMDNGVSKQAWANIYADQLDLISNLAFENNQLDIAGKYKVEAAKMRGVGREESSQIPPELLDRRPILYTIDISNLGLKPVNRRELGGFIDKLEVTEKEKSRLRNDARINDIEFEFLPNDSNNDE